MVTPAKRLAHGIDIDAVEQAIRAAELRTSGEIRVAVARSWFWGDARAAAERQFRRLGVSQTRARNGVLIFVAPRPAQAGGAGRRRHPGEGRARAMGGGDRQDGRRFRRGEPTAGLVAGVELLGNALVEAFPRGADDVNELTNSVSVDER
jgi:uncharacterized membrane protein